MHIATAWSVDPDAERAAIEAYGVLLERLGHEPRMIFLQCSVSYDAETLARTMGRLAQGVPLQGGSSCLGVMTEEGFHGKEGFGLGLLGIHDLEGAYGVGAASLQADPRIAARSAVEAALASARREGEAPAMIWMTAAPGVEESLIAGIADVLGKDVPVAGGSTADDAVAGRWIQFAGGEVLRDSVVVTAMYPSTNVLFAFHSGYEPSEKRGRITRAAGRVLHEIDGRKAAQVYDEWTGGAIAHALSGGGSVLAQTTLHPLGRKVGTIGEVPYFQLSHPDRVGVDGSVSLFSEIAEGEELVLMKGTRESLVTRAGRVAQAARRSWSAEPSAVAGGLVIYCAGCMLTVKDRIDDVVESLRHALDGRPFLGAFTFGEQGCFMRGENRHGNLMISVLVLEDDERPADDRGRG